MDYILNVIGPAILVLASILGWLYTHRKKLVVIAKLAERSFWIVEELAIASGLSTADKIDAFKIQFTEFMAENKYWMTEKNLAMALKLASGLAAKYRKDKK